MPYELLAGSLPDVRACRILPCCVPGMYLVTTTAVRVAYVKTSSAMLNTQYICTTQLAKLSFNHSIGRTHI